MVPSRRVLYASCAVVGLVAAGGGWVLADDFVISTPVTTTNGGNTLGTGDSITITETGSIAPGTGDPGVRATVDIITVVNSGTIATSGRDAYGIELQNGNTVTNFGIITTSGRDSRGIQVNNDGRIFNYGAITTSGNSSNAAVMNEGGSIFNFGLITTTGNTSCGILVNRNIVVTNAGSITTFGDISDGIIADSNNTIINSGMIATRGDFAPGIAPGEFAFGNVIINTGTITTTGSTSPAISMDDSTITNYGRLVSVQSDAIRLTSDGDPSTLNLHAPSFLGGRIDLGDGTTVSIVSGPSHSILWDLSTGTMDGGAPTLSGPVPIFYNSATRQVATFDPTALSASANALGDMSGNLSALMRQRLSASQSGGGDAADASFVSAFAAADENAGVSAIDRIAAAFADTTDADTGWWVSGFGSFADYDGSAATLDHSFDHSGVAVGYDWQPSSDLTLGVMAGYGMGSFDTDSRFANAFDNSADGVFAAFYGRRDFAHIMFVGFALSGGLLSHSDNRFVNDNLAPLGVSSASADYTSWWLSPEMTLGIDFDDVMGSDWRFTPSAGVRYAMQSLDGYTETGPSAANATVSARDVALLETRLELAGRRDIHLATFSGHFTGRLGWQHRAAMGDDGTTVAMIGQTNTVGASGQDDSSAYIGFDAALDIGNSASLALGGDYRVGAHSDAYRATATLTVTF
jgi:uncharacterized protein with beta-barrel porin domain